MGMPWNTSIDAGTPEKGAHRGRGELSLCLYPRRKGRGGQQMCSFIKNNSIELSCFYSNQTSASLTPPIFSVRILWIWNLYRWKRQGQAAAVQDWFANGVTNATIHSRLSQLNEISSETTIAVWDGININCIYSTIISNSFPY